MADENEQTSELTEDQTTTERLAAQETPETTGDTESAPVKNLFEDKTSGEESVTEVQKPTEKQADASDDAGDAPVYEPFTLPENYTARDEDLKVFADLAGELKADQGQAQKLVDLGIALVQNSLQGAEQARAADSVALQNEWKEALDKDPELGGKNWEQTEKNVNAFQRAGFADDELFQYLQDTGQIFKPAFVRMFSKLGATLQEGSISLGSGDAPSGKSPAQRMFSNSEHV